MANDIWAILGITKTDDPALIKAAYARSLKAAQADPEEFQNLRQAYEKALNPANAKHKQTENVKKPLLENATALDDQVAKPFAAICQALEKPDSDLEKTLSNLQLSTLSFNESNRLEASLLKFLAAGSVTDLDKLKKLQAVFGWADITHPMQTSEKANYNSFLKQVEAAQFYYSLVDRATKRQRIYSRAAKLLIGKGKPEFFVKSAPLDKILRNYLTQIENLRPWGSRYFDSVRLEWITNIVLEIKWKKELIIIIISTLLSILLIMSAAFHIDEKNDWLSFARGCFVIIGIFTIALSYSYRLPRLHKSILKNASNLNNSMIIKSYIKNTSSFLKFKNSTRSFILVFMIFFIPAILLIGLIVGITNHGAKTQEHDFSPTPALNSLSNSEPPSFADKMAGTIGITIFLAWRILRKRPSKTKGRDNSLIIAINKMSEKRKKNLFFRFIGVMVGMFISCISSVLLIFLFIIFAAIYDIITGKSPGAN